MLASTLRTCEQRTLLTPASEGQECRMSVCAFFALTFFPGGTTSLLRRKRNKWQCNAQTPASDARFKQTLGTSKGASICSWPVVVIGAGPAGLAAAKYLGEAGIPVRLLEAEGQVGGRMRSDLVDGFVLDRGFQVFIEAYPEQRKLYETPQICILLVKSC